MGVFFGLVFVGLVWLCWNNFLGSHVLHRTVFLLLYTEFVCCFVINVVAVHVVECHGPITHCRLFTYYCNFFPRACICSSFIVASNVFLPEGSCCVVVLVVLLSTLSLSLSSLPMLQDVTVL